MKKIYFIAVLTALLLPCLSEAQFSLQNGDHTFDIGGNFIGGYQYYFYPPGTTADFHKDEFILDQARVNLRGRINNHLQYKFEFDFAGLIEDIQTPSPQMHFLTDAYVEYKTPYVNIKTGYQKVPYSFYSLMEEIDAPFLERPALITKINSRRDLGVTLSHEFKVLGLALYGGVYSGMGEEVFSTDNPSGRPELIGRIQYAFPGKTQLSLYDFRCSPVPVFQCGLSARYAQDGITSGESGNDYTLLTIDGKKTVYGADGSVFYKGFTLYGEITQDHIVPLNTALLYSEGTQYTYFNAGGFIGELDYYNKCLKSLVGVRYDQLDPSDLVYGGTQRTVGFCYNYLIQQNYLVIKFEYDDHLPTPYQSVVWKGNEINLELQWIFN
jgi:hypothetical protein